MMPVTALEMYGDIPVVIERRRGAVGNLAVSDIGHVLDNRDPPQATKWTYSLNLRSATREQASLIAAIKPAAEDPLEGFAAFQSDNWDGEGAKGISPETIGAASEVLGKLPFWVASPETAPASDGSVGLEWVWECAGQPVKIFVDIEPGRRVRTYVRDPHGLTSETTKSLDDLDIRDHLEGLFLRATGSAEEAA